MIVEVPYAIPLAVVAAIGLFFTKELVEWVRRSSANGRKNRAIKQLLTVECEQNNFAIRQMRDQAEIIKQAVAHGHDIKVEHPRTGRERLMITGRDGHLASGPIATLRTAVLDRYFFESASLDKKLFNLMHEAGNALSALQHVRDGFITCPTDQPDHLDGFPNFAVSEINTHEKPIHALYEYIAGEPLTKMRVR